MRVCAHACVAEGEGDGKHGGPCTRRFFFLKARVFASSRQCSENTRFKVCACNVSVCVCVRAGDVCRTWQPDNLCVCVPLCTADSNHLNWNEPDLCNFPCDGRGGYETSPTVLSRVIQEAKVYSLFSPRRQAQKWDLTLKYCRVLNLLLYMLLKCQFAHRSVVCGNGLVFSLQRSVQHCVTLHW